MSLSLACAGHLEYQVQAASYVNCNYKKNLPTVQAKSYVGVKNM